MSTSDSTLLAITGLDLPPYSARGLQQSLDPIEAAANLRRTINGNLKDFGFAQFQKYKSTIQGTDQQPPAYDGVWPGKSVTVDCIPELSYLTAGGSPARPVVATRTEGDFTFYRPRLTMRVAAFTHNKNEWGATVNWQLDLEEI